MNQFKTSGLSSRYDYWLESRLFPNVSQLWTVNFGGNTLKSKQENQKNKTNKKGFGNLAQSVK